MLKQSNLNHNQDAFGSALALSGDGRTLVVDAADEDGTVGGINGAQYDGRADWRPLERRALSCSSTRTAPGRSRPTSSRRTSASTTCSASASPVSRERQRARRFVHAAGRRRPRRHREPAGLLGAKSPARSTSSRAPGTTWTQRAYLKSPNSDAHDEFGSGVAMSGDGNTLAIAAFGEDGGSAGVGGNQADNSVAGIRRGVCLLIRSVRL